MQRNRSLALLLALALLSSMALGASAQDGNGTSDDDDRDEMGDGNGPQEDRGPKNKTDKDRGRDAHPEHPQNKTPQGKALGRDMAWHECRDAAVDEDNETQKRECHDAAMERANERHAAIKAARANGSVGGELNISRGEHRIDNATGVAFEVETADESDDPEAPDVRVEVGADLDRGQTIVLDVDPALFDEDAELVIAYYDVADDGSETLNTSFSEAASLEDVLDPDDDDGPEYWIVEDPEGLHVLVSIPTWSVHAVTLEGSVPGPDAADIPVVAVGLLIATFVTMGAMLWWQRPGKGA